MAKKTLITVNSAYREAKAGFITVDGAYRKIKKGLRTVGGVWEEFFSGGVDVATMNISFSGNMIDHKVVTMGNGKQYRLLELTSSGTLTLDEEVNADVWLCGGGTQATSAKYAAGGLYSLSGGSGGSFNQTSMGLLSVTVTVGAGNGGVTTISNGSTSISNNTSGSKTGGGGGTSGHLSTAGVGGAKAAGDTRPFGDSYFSKYPCAGGGGGGYYGADERTASGGGGGSSLSAGNNGIASYYSYYAGGAGGTTGGGAGGKGVLETTCENGGNASYYGSGGGAPGHNGNKYFLGSFGSGYQGACFIRIPLEQSA